MVALLGMFLVPVTVLRSLAAGAVIVGVVSVAAALTLLPAMLSLVGDRVNSLPLPIVGKNLGRSGAAGARIWTAVTATVMRRPAVSLVLAGGFMVLSTGRLGQLQCSSPRTASTPRRPRGWKFPQILSSARPRYVAPKWSAGLPDLGRDSGVTDGAVR